MSLNIIFLSKSSLKNPFSLKQSTILIINLILYLIIWTKKLILSDSSITHKNSGKIKKTFIFFYSLILSSQKHYSKRKKKQLHTITSFYYPIYTGLYCQFLADLDKKSFFSFFLLQLQILEMPFRLDNSYLNIASARILFLNFCCVLRT